MTSTKAGIVVSAGDQYVTVPGGATLLEVHAALPEGLYPPFPPVELPDGVAGLVERGGFAQTFFFASEVLGATFRSRSGRVIRAGGQVVKNVQGYDLVRPLVGSFGALGEIVDVTFRLRPGRAWTHLVRAGRLEDVPRGLTRFAWEDGAEVHVAHFGSEREVARVREAFGGRDVTAPLDYRDRFPRGMGVGQGPLRDARFTWADTHERPPVPALFDRLARSL